jgi:hypothetical protein
MTICVVTHYFLVCRANHTKGFPYFSALIALRQAGQSLDTTQYAYCLRYILVSLYTWTEQARPQAIEQLLLSDLEEAVNNVVFSEAFKTSGVYGYQPVTMTALLELWIRYLRPETSEGNPALFLTSTGQKLAQGYVTKALHTYFAHFGLDVNVTSIRRLIEVCLIYNM